DHLAGLDVEVDVVEHRHRLGAGGEAPREAAQGDQRGHVQPPRLMPTGPPRKPPPRPPAPCPLPPAALRTAPVTTLSPSARPEVISAVMLSLRPTLTSVGRTRPVASS